MIYKNVLRMDNSDTRGGSLNSFLKHKTQTKVWDVFCKQNYRKLPQNNNQRVNNSNNLLMF